MRAGIICFRHEHLCRAAQVAIIRRVSVHEFLRGSDVVFFQQVKKLPKHLQKLFAKWIGQQDFTLITEVL